MADLKDILKRIQADYRYQENLDWGAPRPGHPEGTIRAHIEELEKNLNLLRSRVGTQENYDKIKILIHVHDTFKPDAAEGVPISHPRSHATLAKEFLAEFHDDGDLLNMVQYHDAGFAIWRSVNAGGDPDMRRVDYLVKTIEDWNLFLLFQLVDGCTEGKSRDPLHWLLPFMKDHVEHRIETAWIF
jgi:hypothetical protein